MQADYAVWIPALYALSQLRTGSSPSLAPSATAWRFAGTSVRTGAGLEAAAPVAVYCGGPTPCRRRLNIHRQRPKIGMQKPAYPTDCISIGAHSLCTGPSPSPASPATAWRFPLRRSASPRRVAETSVRAGAGLGDATHISSRSYRVAASIRPRSPARDGWRHCLRQEDAGADWGWFSRRLNTYPALAGMTCYRFNCDLTDYQPKEFSCT